MTIPLHMWIMEVHNTLYRGCGDDPVFPRIPLRQRIEHDTLPNLFDVVHVHPLYVALAHKSKMEVSLGVAQTGARLPLDDAIQQS